MSSWCIFGKKTKHCCNYSSAFPNHLKLLLEIEELLVLIAFLNLLLLLNLRYLLEVLVRFLNLCLLCWVQPRFKLVEVKSSCWVDNLDFVLCYRNMSLVGRLNSVLKNCFQIL